MEKTCGRHIPSLSQPHGIGNWKLGKSGQETDKT